MYNLKTIHPRDIVGYQQVITFNTNNPKVLPVQYLAHHMACAKVAHLSAATKYFNSVIWEMEETLVLSSDGASAVVLEHVIWTTQCKPDPV